jgi:hypothetical protein
MRIQICLAMIVSLFVFQSANAAGSGGMSINAGFGRDVTFSVLGAYDQSKTSATGFTLSSAGGGGGAVFGNISLAGPVGLSVGGIYYVRTWSDTTSGTESIKSQVTTVPFLLTLQLPLIHLGVGGYSSTWSSPFTETGTTNSNNLTAASYGIGTSDSGYAGDVGLDIPLGGRAAFRFDALFLSGISSMATNSSNKFTIQDTIYMAGVTFAVTGSAGGGYAGSTKR